MSTKQKRTIDDEVSHILEELEKMPVDSKEYEVAVRNLEVLGRTRKEGRVSMDTIVLAATNILGIILVLNYEQFHVVASKSFGLILKGR